jgi:hypothetical protein
MNSSAVESIYRLKGQGWEFPAVLAKSLRIGHPTRYF